MNGLMISLLAIGAMLVGLAIGWVLGNRPVAAACSDATAREADFRRAITDLAGAEQRARDR